MLQKQAVSPKLLELLGQLQLFFLTSGTDDLLVARCFSVGKKRKPQQMKVAKPRNIGIELFK
jgi:hypothetical protein